MKDFDVKITDEAIADLEAIFHYISNSLMEPIYALGQVNRIREKITGLNSLPLRNQRVEREPWHSKGIRQMPVDNFIVYYSAEEEKRQSMF